MPTGTYERYGLTGNPFRDLASESLDNVGIYHVNQETDETLRTIKDEVLDKENRAVVAVIGELGAGKTERLLVALAEARERNAFAVYFDVTTKTPWVLRGLAAEFQKRAVAAKLVKMFGSPPWLRPIASYAKAKDGAAYDPTAVGRAFGAALNATAPSFLLLNDLHNLIESKEVDAFSRVLQEITDVTKPGVLVMFTCYSSYLAWLTVNHPALASRINRTFPLKSFSDDEAGLILAKKLLVKRLVEDLDPIYPFDREAVHELNQSAHGNPRRLLELADLAVEYGVAHRAYRVDADVVRTVLTQRQATEVGADMLRPASANSPPKTLPTPNPPVVPSASVAARAPWVETK
jgi:type II secretory pathway predicted ATPase ExeA